MLIFSNRLMFLTVLIAMIFISLAGNAQCILPSPDDLKPKSIASCQFTAKWKLVDDATGYLLHYKKSADSDWIVVNGIGNVDSYLISELDAVTSYHVKVAAVCESNENGIFSEPIEVTTLACSEPVDLVASGITESSATLSWSIICDAPKFTVRYRKSGIIEWSAFKSIPDTFYTFTGLETNTTYEVKVESKCDGIDSEYSPSIFFTTLSECLLPSPVDLKAKSITSCQFLAKWTFVEGATSYSMHYKKTTDLEWMVVNDIGNVDSYLLTELEAVTSYLVKVTAVCEGSENRLFSEPIEVTTLACSEPVDLVASLITESSATLSWSQVCSAPKFTVRYRKSGIIEWSSIKSIPETFYNFTELESNTTYEVKVESKCDSIDSEYSPSIYFTTLSGCFLPSPGDLKPKSIASCQFTAKWQLVDGATGYALLYKKTALSEWIAINNIGNVDSYVLTELDAVTSYQVKVAAVCESNENGIFSEPIEVTTLACSEPVDLVASAITSSTATLSWAEICSSTKFTVRYRKSGIIEWSAFKSIPDTFYNFTGLDASTTYEVKVESKCDGVDSEYSPSIFFTTLSGYSGRNVLLIIVDDARFDTYTATGGPSFFNDVNISRIANEGVNFTQGFATLSMCAPSRGTIITGLYPHTHGITDNVQSYKSDTLYHETIGQILQNNGYYTGLIGKFHVSYVPLPGFNYWMESHNSDYKNSQFNLNGTKKIIKGHLTDVVTDSAIAFFHKVPEGSPFFLWLGYKAPHTPAVPRIEDEGLFDSFDMPVPDNFYKYTENVPDFLYYCHGYGNPTYIDDYYNSYFELLNGVETRLGDIFNELSAMGIMDSTLIIFMSDNGYMLGEHLLMEKQLAYEESIHVPIFMRYPTLIPPGTVVNDQIALNLDIAPTILDFAGIEDTFGLQGISLLKLVDGSASRTEMMYEFINKSCVPDIRGVRSLTHKYVQYHCPESTEEFFDLVNDPLENTNVVNDPAYTALLETYRDKLTFLRNYYEDFTWDSLYECSLSNPQRLTRDEDDHLVLLNTFPNPANGSMVVHFISSEKNNGSLQIVNALGKVVFHQQIDDPHTDFSTSIRLESIPPGNYFAVMQHGTNSYRKAFIKQ